MAAIIYMTVLPLVSHGTAQDERRKLDRSIFYSICILHFKDFFVSEVEVIWKDMKEKRQYDRLLYAISDIQ